MLFEHSLSDAGRASGRHIEALRITLGPGVDPAYDYSKATRPADGHDMRASASETFLDAAHGPSQAFCDSNTTASLALLRTALNRGAPKELADAAPAALEQGTDVTELRDDAGADRPKAQQRPSSAFQRVGRKEMTVPGDAPPPGYYRPNMDVSRPRVKGITEFPGSRKASKRRLQEAADSEPDALACPEKAKPHLRGFSIGKTPSRPDLLKTASMTLTDSHSVAHIEDAYEVRTEAKRVPAWDFGKLVPRAAEAKPQSGAEPGSYDANVDVVKARPRSSNVYFAKQVARRPMSAPCGPDRKLLPPNACSALSTTRRVPRCDFSTLTERPPLISTPEDNSAAAPLLDPEADRVLACRRRPRTAGSFSHQPSRSQDLRSKRMFAEDITARRIEDNLRNGPKSTDSLPGDFNDRPCLRRRAQCLCDMGRTPGRAAERRQGIPPSRRRAQSAGSFRRPARAGEAKAHGGQVAISQLAIAVLRASRTYEAMPESEEDPDSEAEGGGL